MSYTPDSPKGREIKHVAGDASTIISRGHDITTLGDQMEAAATTLKRLKDSSVDGDGQKGKAIEALRDSIDDSADKLGQAADLYKPFGPVMVAYGTALQECKPHIDALADACEEAWTHYTSLPSPSPFATLPGAPEPETPEAQAAADLAADQAQAKENAYNAWHEKAQSWDGYYDTWEEAFDTACHDVSDATSGKIKDGFWEVLGDIGDFLSIVAIVVGVLALVIGGPFVAIALAVSLAVLAVTALQVVHGDKNGWDLAFAAIACLPFGKFGAVFKGEMTFLQATFKPLSSFGSELTAFKGAISSQGFIRGAFANGNPGGITDLFTRSVLGNSATDLSEISSIMTHLSPGQQFAVAHLDIMGGQVKQLLDYADWTGIT